MNTIKIKNWGLGIDAQNSLVIAGPCSAETEIQVMESCQGAAMQGAHILRAGIWKPRTRPGSFEGVGEVGLPWIKNAGLVTGLPVMVEVANVKHVKAALKHQVDILWIGARTTVNPFAVQEIAEALKGYDIPVFIKNPINPDLELWIGAAERLYKAGVSKIALIHRGFSVAKSTPYRNVPLWEIPIEFKRRYPEFEIICDPSHICGNRILLQEVAQKAYNLNFDGLMIETHISPDQALSDALQQVTPEELGLLLNSLILRKPLTDDIDFLANLEALRVDIDSLDRDTIELLVKRMEVVREIGLYKKRNGVTILQMNRWSELFNDRVTSSINAGLSEIFAKALIQVIHNESIRQQELVMNAVTK